MKQLFTQNLKENFLPKTIHRIDSAPYRELDSPLSLSRSVVNSETTVSDAFFLF